MWWLCIQALGWSVAWRQQGLYPANRHVTAMEQGLLQEWNLEARGSINGDYAIRYSGPELIQYYPSSDILFNFLNMPSLAVSSAKLQSPSISPHLRHRTFFSSHPCKCNFLHAPGRSFSQGANRCSSEEAASQDL